MISAKSLFNKALYQNSVHRFKWGSFLYFIILFFFGPFVFLIQKPSEMMKQYEYSSWYNNGSLIDNYEFRLVPILLAIAIPTIVALLVYNGVHNSKHGVFMHSMPTTRKSNYFTCALSAFTLMILPVAAITAIYILLSFVGYGKLIGIAAALRWFAVNVFVLIVMFSVASFSAFLTGNMFAMVGINVIIHIIPLVLALAIVTAGNNFIYGFSGEYSFAEFLVEKAPIVWIMKNGLYSGSFKNPTWLCYFIFAVIVYFLTYILYKNRKMESCGDVAAFDVFKPILKYGVTVVAAIVSSAISVQTDIVGMWFKVFIVVVVCAIVYFASEMFITKSFRVFKAYKGFAAFFVCYAAVVSFFAFTSVFGYETYIPSAEHVKQISVYDWDNENEPFVSDESTIKKIIKAHKELTNDIPVINDKSGHELNFVYKLDNGKIIKREYNVSYDELSKVMSLLFENSDYKLQYTNLKYLNTSNLIGVNLDMSTGDNGYSWAMNENSEPLLEAVKKDMRELSYNEYESVSNIMFFINISISKEENIKLKIFDDKPIKDFYECHISINGNYKNTLEFLKDVGYGNLVKNYILRDGLFITENIPVSDGDMLTEANMVLLDNIDAQKLYDEYAFSEDLDNENTTDCYYVFGKNQDEKYKYNCFVKIPKNQMPDYLLKYVK